MLHDCGTGANERNASRLQVIGVCCARSQPEGFPKLYRVTRPLHLRLPQQWKAAGEATRTLCKASMPISPLPFARNTRLCKRHLLQFCPAAGRDSYLEARPAQGCSGFRKRLTFKASEPASCGGIVMPTRADRQIRFGSIQRKVLAHLR